MTGAERRGAPSLHRGRSRCLTSALSSATALLGLFYLVLTVATEELVEAD